MTEREPFIQEVAIRYPAWKHLLWIMRMGIGRLIDFFYGPHRETLELKKIYSKRVIKDRLSSDELEAMIEFQLAVEDLEYRMSYFRNNPLLQTYQGQVLPLIKKLIEYDPTIATITNIGVRYAFVDHEMAKMYPNVHFTGIDFMPNLSEMNAEFQLDNLDFISGYALDLINDPVFNSDIVFFSSTATAINNLELRLYLQKLHGKAKYILFNEPLFALPGGRVLNPEKAPVDSSIPTYLQPVIITDKTGPLCQTHNYKGMLEEAGYKILHYHVYKPDFLNTHVVHAIGQLGIT